MRECRSSTREIYIFTLRVAMLPQVMIEYVVVHELDRASG